MLDCQMVKTRIFDAQMLPNLRPRPPPPLRSSALGSWISAGVMRTACGEPAILWPILNVLGCQISWYWHWKTPFKFRQIYKIMLNSDLKCKLNMNIMKLQKQHLSFVSCYSFVAVLITTSDQGFEKVWKTLTLEHQRRLEARMVPPNLMKQKFEMIILCRIWDRYGNPLDFFFFFFNTYCRFCFQLVGLCQFMARSLLCLVAFSEIAVQVSMRLSDFQVPGKETQIAEKSCDSQVTELLLLKSMFLFRCL